MRLFLASDATWLDVDYARTLLSQVRPSVLVLLERTSGTEDQIVAGFPTVERVPHEKRIRRAPAPAGCHLALVFAGGSDAWTLHPRGSVPLAVVRDRAGAELQDRIERATCSTVDVDLGRARAVLLALLPAAPELREDIVRAGTVVAAAIAQPYPAEVTAAWSAVENLRVSQPRLAPWLIGVEHLFDRAGP